MAYSAADLLKLQVRRDGSRELGGFAAWPAAATAVAATAQQQLPCPCFCMGWKRAGRLLTLIGVTFSVVRPFRMYEQQQHSSNSQARGLQQQHITAPIAAATATETATSTAWTAATALQAAAVATAATRKASQQLQQLSRLLSVCSLRYSHDLQNMLAEVFFLMLVEAGG